MDCSGNAAYAFSFLSLPDRFDYHSTFAANRIQFLLLRLNAEERVNTLNNFDNFEETLVNGNKDELDELKAWMFKENIRLELERNELLRMEDKFLKEKQQFQTEMTTVNHRLVIERKRLKQDEAFFDKKMDILKNGFAQLDVERKKLEKERLLLDAEKSVHSSHVRQDKNIDLAEMLFQGVNSHLALKKRYKDLVKMFHPDNIAGDNEMVLVINKIYEELRRDYEMGRRA